MKSKILILLTMIFVLSACTEPYSAIIEDLTAESQLESITYSWTNPTNEDLDKIYVVEFELTEGYEGGVYEITRSNGISKLLDSTETSYTATDLVSGSNYGLEVICVSSAGLYGVGVYEYADTLTEE